MAHKSKLRGGTVTSSVPLPERIARARKEGRFQQALELSRQFHKQDSSETSLALLRQVTVERADQLHSQGHLQESAQTLGNVLDMGGPPDFQRRVIEKLAGCGCIAQALQLTERLGDPSLRADVLDLAADHALRQGNASLLPAELHPQFAAVVQAFSQAQTGKDDEAKAALQTIGLTSPFLEWRILLRGLLAYYANDDARALENWQRLDPRRLPARLAAPLRMGIDADYRAAQPPETQNALRRQCDSLQGAGSLPALRTIQALLVHRDKTAQAFRAVEGILPTLRQQAPHLVPRLAACFRWAVIDHGQPEDLDRYLRVFGPLPDDRQLHRMRALALEKNGLFPEAHECWQLFEKEVAAAGTIWPGEQARHVRALIWSHIGAMAAEVEDEEADGQFLPFARPRNQGSQFRPNAEECLRKSLELAPESLTSHESLFRFLLEKPAQGPVFAAGKKLLERFPEHVETLRTLGSICMEEMRLDEARDYLRRALAASPLEAELRAQLMKVHEMRARELARGKRFDDAREACRSALALCDFPSKYSLYSLQAAIELKAKNAAGYQERVAAAENDAGHRLPVAYCLMCESIRLKLTPAQKKPLAAEVQAGFAAEVDPSVIPTLLGVLVLQRLAGSVYTGQKAHEKKVLGLVEKAPLQPYPEDSVEAMCESLLSLDAAKCLKRCVSQARKLFPANPGLMLIEADLLLRRTDDYRCRQLLAQARTQIEALPRGDRQQQLFERLGDIEEQLRASDGMHGLMSRMMDMFDLDDDNSF